MAAIEQQQPSISLNQQVQDIARQRAIAKALMEQKQTVDPSQMVSGRIVPYSPINALGPVLANILGAYKNSQAMDKQASLDDEKMQRLQSMFSGGKEPDMAAIASSGLASPDDLIKAVMHSKSSGSVNRGQVVPLGDGSYGSYDPQKQSIAPILDPNGKPYASPIYTPQSQYGVKLAQEAAKGVTATDAAGSQFHAPQGQINPAFNQSLQQAPQATQSMQQDPSNPSSPQFAFHTPEDFKAFALSPEGQALLGQGGVVKGPSLADQAAVKRENQQPESWQTQQDANGNLIQINPKTGDIRPLGVKGPKAESSLAEKSKIDAQQNVAATIASLRDQYSQLQDAGGITDTSANGLHNLGASAGSSALGQAVGGMFGTKNQSLRNDIAMTRPILLQQIMKATGMTSRQLDSNAELKLYLSTATDPTKDVQANMRALDNLEKLYGGGSQGGDSGSLDQPPQPGGGLTPDEQAELDQLRARFGK